MKTIVYPAKFYIVYALLNILGLTFSIIALFFLDGSVDWFIWILCGIFAIISLMGLSFTLWDIQWINIDSKTIYACNIFGVIKKLDIAKLQAVKIINARAWGLKMYSKHYSCIAVSSRKSIKPSDIQDSYNHRKCYYIIFPNTYSNRKILKNAYIDAAGKELEIE